MALEGESDAMVQELVERVRTHVMLRRIRTKEFFTDFDPLKSGRCTEVAFIRALANMGMVLSEEEATALSNHFTEHGPHAVRPQIICYQHFCKEVDDIFLSVEQQDHMRSNMMTSSPGSTVTSQFRQLPPEEETRYMHVLHRLATLCKARGVMLKHVYADIDKTLNPSPSMLHSRRGGRITREQFVRAFPFKTEMSTEDVDLLCAKYAGKHGDVSYMALHNEITEVLESCAQPFPCSPLHLRPDMAEWSHQTIDVVDRIRAKVVEKRIRLIDSFQDFDPLRKGYCLPGQVKTVFTVLNLSKEIDRNDFENLLAQYVEYDGRFNYKALVNDVDEAFTKPGLEKEPLTQIDMPSPLSTACARRNPMKLSNHKLSKIGWFMDKVRTIVRKNRIDMKPMFMDFDRANRGYISRNQFQRIMAMLNMGLDEKAITYLCSFHCDLGNHNDFNWKKFLKEVDPPSPEVEKAMKEMTGPFIAFKPRPYFDKAGQVISKSMSMPTL